eukprot:CAMPEP_0171253464 /NCGR_PEP_ID=MMETSP0790-20130122/51719_1 /TAXON_ID=2925 /ORGANISM="Alexandrium catenella, Strain OF101" /LENGTH=182 /DNA_ID=CAMNT_0011721295 /DNA_START=19 /DNA_END=564 /DNA_ORIENTATION=-
MGGYGALAKMGRNRDGSVNHALRAQHAANREAAGSFAKGMAKESAAGAAAGAVTGAVAGGGVGAAPGAGLGALGGAISYMAKKVMGDSDTKKPSKKEGAEGGKVSKAVCLQAADAHSGRCVRGHIARPQRASTLAWPGGCAVALLHCCVAACLHRCGAALLHGSMVAWLRERAVAWLHGRVT